MLEKCTKLNYNNSIIKNGAKISMIDINKIRNNPTQVQQALAKKGYNIDFSDFLELDEKRRATIANVEQLKAEKNAESAKVPAMKKAGQDTSAIFARMKQIGQEVSVLDATLAELNNQINDILLGLPNMPDDDLLPGEKENNKVVYVFGEKPNFNFTPKSHIELCEDLGLIDYERGAKLAGNGSWIYTGLGAQLEWALINYFVQQHLADGYEFLMVPHMLNYDCGIGAGQFPKFEDDVYWIDQKSKTSKFLLPTAETALVNVHAGEIMNEDSLPKKYFAYTPCYRREAGSYRSEERGMIRGHQFNKVEMVQYTKPDQSDKAFDELVQKAQKLVEDLGLHFHTSKLAAGDCSASMARTYDIEVWIPSMNIYKEASSVSNAREYQARRNNIRFRNQETKKVEFVNTLNGSGLATSRLFPALLEQCQDAEGSILIPNVLQPFMGGMTKISKKETK